MLTIRMANQDLLLSKCQNAGQDPETGRSGLPAMQTITGLIGGMCGQNQFTPDITHAWCTQYMPCLHTCLCPCINPYFSVLYESIYGIGSCSIFSHGHVLGL